MKLDLMWRDVQPAICLHATSGLPRMPLQSHNPTIQTMEKQAYEIKLHVLAMLSHGLPPVCPEPSTTMFKAMHSSVRYFGHVRSCISVIHGYTTVCQPLMGSNANFDPCTGQAYRAEAVVHEKQDNCHPYNLLLTSSPDAVA